MIKVVESKFIIKLRVKTELLTRMDGANSGDDEKKVVVIGATNRPWDID
jgi:SpoVK/Ycf46/Vps4 family AAA+-type ATPase